MLRQPAARAIYLRRSAIGEPSFAELRERQGLKRFHRRGLKSVRIEFALHRIALNRKKAVSLFILWLRFPPASWHLLRAAFVFALAD